MPGYARVLEEIHEEFERLEAEREKNPHAFLPGPLDVVRRRYLSRLTEKTGRNTILYYSRWLDLPDHPDTIINDIDKNGFMSAVHDLDRTKGLDLVLHTPGGDIAAAESLVHYLREMFGTDIRAIVPQIAMSAGTMVACACRSIVMGKQSNLGPIDPQLNGLPAKGVLEEFNQAIESARNDPSSVPIWQSIIGKYHPTFLGSCQKAITWSEEITREWLRTGMLEGLENIESKAFSIVDRLIDHSANHAHVRHIHRQDLAETDLTIEYLEDDADLQDLVLTTHHACMHTFANSPAVKIIENQLGTGLIRSNAR